MTKYAVTIGTNYVGTDYQLAGCVNDANDWRGLLAAQGYQVDWLIDSAATRDAILSMLNAAVTRARWGDRIVITYSGHGTWIPDYNGDELDGRDEAWCPDDMQTGGLITDDDLARVFAQAGLGVGILVLSDSCFSGTMTRLLGDDQPFETHEGLTRLARFLPPFIAAPVSPDGPASAMQAERDLPLTRTYTEHASLISGCAEPEVSYDAWFGRRANGAFTRAAIDAYVPRASLAAWHNAIRDRLPSDDYPQTPALVPSSRYRQYAKAL